MMRGIPSSLQVKCRDTLLQCQEFSSDSSLRAIFVSAELFPFQSRLPSAQDQAERVDRVLAYLLEKQLSDGRAVLPIFFSALRDRYQEGDALRNRLAELHHALHSIFEESQPSTISLEQASQPLVEAVETLETEETNRIATAVNVFFSYSHKDEKLRDELAYHLSALQRQGIITTWHDRKIVAGSEWAKEIDENLNSADIILLLISQYFLASESCGSSELKQAMERHDRGEICVIPIILRPVDWQGTPFATLKVLPDNNEPVTTWTNQDEAFLNIAQGIRAVAQKILSSRPSLSTSPPQTQKSQRQPNQRVHQPSKQIRRLTQNPSTVNSRTYKTSTNLNLNTSPDQDMDYGKLTDFLNDRNWKQADLETGTILLKLAGQDALSRGYLLDDDMAKLPCDVLRRIDQLWIDYSNARFGFSIQKRIWESVNGNYKKFGDRVGWRVLKTVNVEQGILFMKTITQEQRQEWLPYNQLSFHTQAPEGHLPCGSRSGAIWKIARGKFSSLASKLSECGIS